MEKNIKNQFRFNKKRKHYAYIIKVFDDMCLNIVLTTQPESKQKHHGKSLIIKNIKLYRHPNKNASNITVYIYNHRPYIDHIDSFDLKKLVWQWDINDKRKVKRFKRYKKYKECFEK